MGNGKGKKIKNQRLTTCVDKATAKEVRDVAKEWQRTVSWTLGELLRIGLEESYAANG